MRILFICQGNVNRSQMAGGFMRALMPEVDVETAGISVPDRREDELVSNVSTQAINAMRELGIDTSMERMHRLTPAMVNEADRAILVGTTFGFPVPEYLIYAPQFEAWHIPDPASAFISHRRVRDRIKRRVETLAAELRSR
jgi:arsenate reductase